jgi:hypothetical protein
MAEMSVGRDVTNIKKMKERGIMTLTLPMKTYILSSIFVSSIRSHNLLRSKSMFVRQ